MTGKLAVKSVSGFTAFIISTWELHTSNIVLYDLICMITVGVGITRNLIAVTFLNPV